MTTLLSSLPVRRLPPLCVAIILGAAIAGQGGAAAGCDSCSLHSHAAPKTAAPAPSAAASARPLRFAVVGDTQGLVHLAQLTTDMNRHGPDFALYPGDLVDTGTPAAWAQWNGLSSHFSGGPTNRFMTPGNHDVSPGRPATFQQWREAFPWLPTANSPVGFEGVDYYFDRGDSRFISLTNNTPTQLGGPPPNLAWLKTVLADPATQSKEHVFVMSHHPVTFDVWEPGAPTGGTAGEWWQTLAEGKVTTFFAGHWHQYQPGQPDPLHPTWEVIAGTGNSGFSGHPWQNRVGYSIVEVLGSEVALRFYGDGDGDGSFDDLLDTAILATSAPRPRGVVGAYGFGSPVQNLDIAISPLAKGNHGGYHGNARVAEDPIRGSVLALDGSGDYADGHGIGDYNLAILRDLTIAASARFDVISQAGATIVSYTSDVAGYTDRDEIVNQPFNLSLRRDLHLRAFWERDNGDKVEFVSTSPANVEAGVWADYRFTRDASTGEVRFYVNGVQLGEVLAFDPATQLPTGGQQGILRIGVDFDRDTSEKLTRYFDGAIDNVAIFNTVTLEDYQSPLVGDLNLDGAVTGDGTGPVAVDDVAAFIAGWRSVLPEDDVFMRWTKGDLNLDGVGDLRDLAIFQKALIEHGLTLSAPEPATAALAASGLALATASRRNRVP